VIAATDAIGVECVRLEVDESRGMVVSAAVRCLERHRASANRSRTGFQRRIGRGHRDLRGTLRDAVIGPPRDGLGGRGITREGEDDAVRRGRRRVPAVPDARTGVGRRFGLRSGGARRYLLRGGRARGREEQRRHAREEAERAST
jgi:hypothetical protein